MRIESHIAVTSRDVLKGTDTDTAAGRQVLSTSEPDDNTTGQTRSDTVSVSNETSFATVQNQALADVHEAVEKLNEYVQSQEKSVNFSVDETTNATVIKVYKTETGELVRQFPPEEILSMAAHISQSIGLMYDNKA